MKVYNFLENDDVSVVAEDGPFKVIEWARDLSVPYAAASWAYFASAMGVRRRQVVCELDGKASVVVQAGAMQWTVGRIDAGTGIKGVGDLFGKVARGAVTGESAVKPEYRGAGIVVLEPTYRHVLLKRPSYLGGSMTVNDGMFYACEGTVRQRAAMVKRPSGIVAGNEGLFNLALEGDGVVALESPVPEEEIVTVDLEGDELKVDGSFAIAWSTGLEFTVERSSRSLVGSAVTGEGLVNVYRGHGRVLLAPVSDNRANPNAGSGVAGK